jgi:hypothetical protein
MARAKKNLKQSGRRAGDGALEAGRVAGQLQGLYQNVADKASLARKADKNKKQIAKQPDR